jgi:hypothetical protein
VEQTAQKLEALVSTSSLSRRREQRPEPADPARHSSYRRQLTAPKPPAAEQLVTGAVAARREAGQLTASQRNGQPPISRHWEL